MIKIGYSESPIPDNRMKTMQTSSPYKLELIGYILTTRPVELERLIHQHFAEHRFNGEWFRLSRTDVVGIITMSNNGVIVSKKRLIEPSPNQVYDINQSSLIINEFLESRKGYNTKYKIVELFMLYPDLKYTHVAECMGVSRQYVTKIVQQNKCRFRRKLLNNPTHHLPTDSEKFTDVSH